MERRGEKGWRQKVGKRNSGGFNRNHEDKMAGEKERKGAGDREGMDSGSTLNEVLESPTPAWLQILLPPLAIASPESQLTIGTQRGFWGRGDPQG